LNVSFIVYFQVVSNRLWAHTKQKKGHCVRIRSSQRFSLYNIKRDNLFQGRLFSLQGCKKNKSPFPSEWEVWKNFFQNVISFSSAKNSFIKILKVSSFKVKVFRKEFFELLRISTLNFEKVCGREFLDSLKV